VPGGVRPRRQGGSRVDHGLHCRTQCRVISTGKVLGLGWSCTCAIGFLLQPRTVLSIKRCTLFMAQGAHGLEQDALCMLLPACLEPHTSALLCRERPGFSHAHVCTLSTHQRQASTYTQGAESKILACHACLHMVGWCACQGQAYHHTVHTGS